MKYLQLLPRALFILLALMALMACPTPTSAPTNNNTFTIPITILPLTTKAFSGTAQFTAPGGTTSHNIFLAIFKGSAPIAGTNQINIGKNPGSPISFSISVDFTSLGFVPISGDSLDFIVFEDLNGNNQFDSGEPSLYCNGKAGGTIFDTYRASLSYSPIYAVTNGLVQNLGNTWQASTKQVAKYTNTELSSIQLISSGNF